MSKKIIALMMVGMLALVVFVGCNSDDTSTPAAPTTTAAAATTAAGETPATTTAEVAAPAEFSYPMDFDGTLTWWKPMENNWATFLTNFGETGHSRALIEATGIDIEWIHPPLGQHNENFSLMVVSGDFPDIIQWNWNTNFPGGPGAAISDRVILELNDAIAQWAPNYQALLARYPGLYQQVVTDEGQHFTFPFLRIDDILKVTTGPVVRADWLEELGLEPPETIDEWEYMLTRFRDDMGATTGWTGQAGQGDPNGLLNMFLPAFGIRTGFFNQGGQIEYGFTDPAFRDFLELMARWYADGLIDPNIFSTSRAEMDAAILTGTSGAVIGPGGGAVGPWLHAAWSNDPGTSFDLVPTRFPSFERGVYVSHGPGSWDFALGSHGHAAISAASSNVEVATRLLDFAFSEEGYLLYNYGVYGHTWTWVNGVPTYTDHILNHPEGRSFAQALSYYARAAMNGPFRQSGLYLYQFYELDQQKEALVQWGRLNDSTATMLPPVSFTIEESNRVAARMADIDTFRREGISRFITGTDPINDDTWNHFVNTLNNFGVPELIEIHQAAMDRFNAR